MIRLEYVTFLVLKLHFLARFCFIMLVTVLMLHSLPFCITFFMRKFDTEITVKKSFFQGPVVQNVVILTSSLRVISLTVLADSIYNTLILFAEKM